MLKWLTLKREVQREGVGGGGPWENQRASLSPWALLLPHLLAKAALIPKTMRRRVVGRRLDFSFWPWLCIHLPLASRCSHDPTHSPLQGCLRFLQVSPNCLVSSSYTPFLLSSLTFPRLLRSREPVDLASLLSWQELGRPVGGLRASSPWFWFRSKPSSYRCIHLRLCFTSRVFWNVSSVSEAKTCPLSHFSVAHSLTASMRFPITTFSGTLQPH